MTENVGHVDLRSVYARVHGVIVSDIDGGHDSVEFRVDNVYISLERYWDAELTCRYDIGYLINDGEASMNDIRSKLSFMEQYKDHMEERVGPFEFVHDGHITYMGEYRVVETMKDLEREVTHFKPIAEEFVALARKCIEE